MILVDPATRQAVGNAPLPGAVRDDSGLYRLTLPPTAAIADTSITLDGRRVTMVLWPLPADDDDRDVLLMHESYHRIAPQLGLQGSSGLGTNEHLDTQDGRTWLRGELHALRVALVSNGMERRVALRDAIAMRLYRRTLFANAAADERGVELNEGLAESTGIDVGLPAEKRIAYALTDIGRVEGAASYVRGFPYGTGPAYAELLDAADGDWRRALRPDSDLAIEAQRAYGLSVMAPAANEATAILARYDGLKIEAEESERVRAIAARNARYQRNLVDGPTLTLPLRNMQIQFNPSAVEAFGTVGSVYHTLTIGDRWGTLHVSGGDALISKSFSNVTVSAPKSVTSQIIEGSGWTLDLAPAAKVIADPERPGSFVLAP
jgi:hypothetical protein